MSLTDTRACRSFIAGTCPHDLFTNTKQDLGPCPKIHSEALKSEYEALSDKHKYGFEYDYLRDMQKYIDECNRRIDAAQRRLEKTPDEIRQTNNLVRRCSIFSTPAHFIPLPPPPPPLPFFLSPHYISHLPLTRHPMPRCSTPTTASTNLRPNPHDQHGTS